LESPQRRALLVGTVAAIATISTATLASEPGSPMGPLPVDTEFWVKPRELWLKRLATGEERRVVFWQNGSYLTHQYIALCQLLRDVNTNSAVQMDPTLLDVLAGLQGYYRAYGFTEPICVTSGYRTAASNSALRAEGAVRNSMHLYGKAADITFPGVPVWHLGRVKQYLHAGGVGFYPSHHFVHIDTGRLRSWMG